MIATKTGTDDSGVDGRSKLKLTVNPIVRSGGLSHLTYTITVLSADQQWDADSLGGDMSELGDNIGENYASGTQLVDTTNKKRYVTAYDATDNTCECSLVANVSLQTGDSRQFFNYFANPPASVHSMDVNFPIFGEVDNVPVQ